MKAQLYIREFNPRNTPFQRKAAELTNDELLALLHCRQYPAWRKQFSQTREQHNASRPAHIRAEIWNHWYEYPHGCEVLNRHFRIVRQLLAERRI